MGSVLIVDDIAGNCRLLESLLTPNGHVVCAASDGDEAVLAVHDAPPDLVLMDVMMPKVDGFEACGAIKQDPSTRLMPVVLVTSLDDTASRLRGIERGNNGAPRSRMAARLRHIFRGLRDDEVNSSVIQACGRE